VCVKNERGASSPSMFDREKEGEENVEEVGHGQRGQQHGRLGVGLRSGRRRASGGSHVLENLERERERVSAVVRYGLMQWREVREKVLSPWLSQGISSTETPPPWVGDEPSHVPTAESSQSMKSPGSTTEKEGSQSQSRRYHSVRR
jgi:hypothetical protein